MLRKEVSKKLYLYAFITSPLLAIYGEAPFYIFEKISFLQAAQLFFLITINILIIWGINIALIKRYKPKRKLYLYIVSAVLGFLSNLPKLIIKPLVDIPFEQILDRYLMYPVLVAIAVNIIIWVIINSVLASDEKKQAEEKIKDLQVTNLETQKQLLIQQLQPHFLFNALSVLKSLIVDNTAKAEQYTVRLSDFLRYSVQSHVNSTVSLEEEIQFTKNYIELQKTRFEDAFDFSLTPLSNDVLRKRLPVYALQILVENALKHNAFSDKKPLLISVDIKEDYLIVRNNRIPKVSNFNTGTGLVNLKKRYELFSTTPIEIEETKDEFIVILQLL